MKNSKIKFALLFLCFVLLIVAVFYCVYFSKYLILPENKNVLNDTDFINRGYFDYDVKSFKKKINNTYSVDVAEEFDPSGEAERIKCPQEKGYITHLIYSTSYSPKSEFFDYKFKGYICSSDIIEYENKTPQSIYYQKNGIYYDRKFKKDEENIKSPGLERISEDIHSNRNNDYVLFLNKLINNQF